MGMKNTTESPLVKRLKSFAWRFGAWLVVASLAWVLKNIGLLELPPEVTAVISFGIGELTKYLNTKPAFNT